MSEEYGNDIISLMDEEGNETEYEMIDAVELDGQTYVALLPLYENPEDIVEEDYQVVILKMVEEDGEEILLTINDEAEFDAVWQAFEDRLRRRVRNHQLSFSCPVRGLRVI